MKHLLPLVAMIGTIAVIPFVAPPNPGCAPLIGCVSATLLLLYWAYRTQNVGHLSKTQQLILVWHLTNGTWWSLGCDVMSGLFAVMPLLNNTYLVIDSKHALGPALSEPRVNLDVVYLTELAVHVPLSLLVFYCYAKKKTARFVLEPLLCGAQIVGTIAYYLPEAITGGHHWPFHLPLIWSLGIGAGAVWIIVPLTLVIRSIGIMQEKLTDGHKSHKNH